MRGFAAIGLQAPKIDANVGGALRAASCYGAGLVALCGQRYSRVAADTTATERHIPVVHVPDLIDAAPYGATIVAVELWPGARNLVSFKHPESAFYIFGPEGGGLRPELIERCHALVSIPTRYCMNLASTVNVVLYDRLAKQGD